MEMKMIITIVLFLVVSALALILLAPSVEHLTQYLGGLGI